MEFSHHSSNPMEARKSDPLNTMYHAALQAQNEETGCPESSDDPIAFTGQEYQSHLNEVVGEKLFPVRRLGPFDVTPKPGSSRVAAQVRKAVDLDGSEDELALVDGDERISEVARVVKMERPRQARKNAVKEEPVAEEDALGFPEDEEDADEITKVEEYYEEEHEGDFYNGEHFTDDDEDMHSIGNSSRLDSRLESLSPLTPLSSNQSSPYSSPQSSRPASPDEAATLSNRPEEEQCEILDEITQLYRSVPELADDYELIDRLGTGTFSSVYKAIDKNYDEWDNQVWMGHHPTDSTAFYQSAGPGYKGRGGRASGWRQANNRMDQDREDMNADPYYPQGNVYVAIKRIYTTSGPERIRNELSIMEECRGTRHTSQIITAFRNDDQVVIVLPYQRNMDFRDFYQNLHPEGIKCYFRCLFRALRDIHARGIIHRDVKPANFLYDPFTGIGTLCDFGLASRMEPPGNIHPVGQCYHTHPTSQDPHGKNRQLDQYETQHIKQAQKEARAKSASAPEKVGYPEQDRRPLSKANRAGTRGFRAPEVLLKCSAQTGAIDVWSAGIILLFFLTGKFPIFQSNDDIEGLMEIAVIIGRKKIEKVATLHGRTLATNVPDLDQDGVSWQEFVERLNPNIWTPRKYDMRFYPHNSKHRDGRGSTLATDMPPPTSSASSSSIPSNNSPSSTPSDPPPILPHSHSDRHANPPTVERYTRELHLAFHFLEQVLQVESTKRHTPRKALYHAFLDEAGVDGDDLFFPHPIGHGVCGDYHGYDAHGMHVAKVLSRCRCKNGGDHRMEEEEEEDVFRRGHGSEDGEDGEGHFVEEEVELQAGQGIAIGQNPCEYHRNLVSLGQ